jgi:hypothetical protein
MKAEVEFRDDGAAHMQARSLQENDPRRDLTLPNTQHASR